MDGEQTKTRREKLEMELALLQADVASLCTKLQQPLDGSPMNDKSETWPQSVVTKTTLIQNNKSKGNSSDVDISTLTEKERIARLQKALDEITRQKKDLALEVDRLQTELEKSSSLREKFIKLKAEHANLQQDYKSLRESLATSEDIRKQQKELIAMLSGNRQEEKSQVKIIKRRDTPNTRTVAKEKSLAQRMRSADDLVLESEDKDDIVRQTISDAILAEKDDLIEDDVLQDEFFLQDACEKLKVKSALPAPVKARTKINTKRVLSKKTKQQVASSSSKLTATEKNKSLPPWRPGSSNPIPPRLLPPPPPSATVKSKKKKKSTSSHRSMNSRPFK